MKVATLSMSHGNSASERGFSINKILLDLRGTSTGEDTISALRFGRLAFLLSVCLFGC